MREKDRQITDRETDRNIDTEKKRGKETRKERERQTAFRTGPCVLIDTQADIHESRQSDKEVGEERIRECGR